MQVNWFTAIAANISQLIAFQSNENELPTVVIIDSSFFEHSTRT